MTRRISIIATAIFFALLVHAQERGEGETMRPLDPVAGLGYKVEAQATVSDGQTPLWLNANRYGLSSLDDLNGYLRAALIRPVCTDSLRRWGVGYGADVAVATGFTSTVIVQQAFAEVRWLNGLLTVGSKQYPLELKNQELSSGSQTLGINARPVPQVRLALPGYWVVPGTNGWLRIKGHASFGLTTDDGWQRDFTQLQPRYTEHVLYHSKAGYLKIGNEERFLPFSVEAGLEMGCLFGGRSYMIDGRTIDGSVGVSSFVHALIPSGTDPTDEDYDHTEGDHLGSLVLRLNYDQDLWAASLYADHFFEDGSQLTLLEFNGYGTGSDYDTWKKNRWFLYDLRDIMLGGEVKLKYSNWVNNIVCEYLYTKYQSGPVYHDRTPVNSEQRGALDNYYNHHLYTGWQHWGQVVGNPLYRSPIYNDDHRIVVEDNRFEAVHVGISGNPADRLHYRLLGTYRKGYGTYFHVYPQPRRDVSLMAEASFRFSEASALRGWSLTGAVGMDHGKWVGNNYGAQITVAYQGRVKK